MRFVLIIGILLSFTVSAQDLHKQRIRRLDTRKKSVFWNSGIFHNGATKRVSLLKNIRHSFTKSKNIERIVFDFDIKNLPKVYGHIDSKMKRIRVDLFDTDLGKTVKSLGKSRLVKNIDFFPLTNGILSVELTFKAAIKCRYFLSRDTWQTCYRC